MRPAILFPLFAPIDTLPGVGPSLAKALGKLAGTRVIDLLWHLPQAIVDRRLSPSIASVEPRRTATLRVRILEHEPPRTRRRPYRILCADDTGELILVFFNARPEYLLKTLPPGETRLVSGMVDTFGEGLQMVHPDYVLADSDTEGLPAMEPVYPLTAGLTGKMLIKVVKAAMQRAPVLDDWLDPAFRSRQGWPGWREALAQAHAPTAEDDLTPMAPARARLAFDELLANQLALAIVRRRLRRQAGRAIRVEGSLARQVVERLGFRLTSSQSAALAEIAADMAQPSRMLRLLQGDVGSGKTVVALLAMLNAVESGAQAALMAPTELLARQHLTTIATLAEAAGVRVALLTGREKEATRQCALQGLASGDVGIVVGTHALLQEAVAFRDLALVVIDEQHRFGVDQRLALSEKGSAADVLVMSATPIPRTLTMTAYGDLDVSLLTEKPPGRQPIDTRVMAIDRLDELVAAIGRMLEGGAKVYWVCPLVEDSAVSDLAAAEQRHAFLQRAFPGRVGLVHGRMKTAERDAAMRAFRDGPSGVLVATTVIEVGVDVPNASYMLVENAERFGLAQLHQLRGRVGRGRRASRCVLLFGPKVSPESRERLLVLEKTDDGFVVAEEDLKRRGPGDALGTRQSGVPLFRVGDLVRDVKWMKEARDEAGKMIADGRDAAFREPLFLRAANLPAAD